MAYGFHTLPPILTLTLTHTHRAADGAGRESAAGGGGL